MNAKTATCNRCGSVEVRWAVGKSGKSYLQNVTSATAYANGAQYGRGPHFKTCGTEAAHRDSVKATALAEVIRAYSATIQLRYLDVFVGPAVAAGTITWEQGTVLRKAAKVRANATATRRFAC